MKNFKHVVPNIPKRLTGKVKYRVDFFGNIVLQVEEVTTVIERAESWKIGKDAHSTVTQYRDATIADVKVLTEKGAGPIHRLRLLLNNTEDSALLGEVYLGKAVFSNKVIVLVGITSTSFIEMADSIRYASKKDFKPEVFKSGSHLNYF